MDITTFLVPNCPKTAIYIPNFISSHEETQILNGVYNAPLPKWDQLSNRRLLNYGGVPHKNGMIAEKMPPWLLTYINKVNNLGIFDTKSANHVLVNEYHPHQGIMPHFDGPLFYPTIATISCGSHTILEFYEATDTNPEYKETESDSESTANNLRRLICKLLIEPRSLLILKDDMYHKYLHSIAELHEDSVTDDIVNLQQCCGTYTLGSRLSRSTRVSLTIRHVPKTSKMKLQLGV